MKIDYSTCWRDESSLKEMVSAVRKHPKFEDIGHGKIIIELLNSIPEKNLNLLDLSCGGGHLSTITKDHKYTGSDMKHIVKNVSKKCYPKNKYIYLDVIEDNLDILKSFDIIVMNAIIDILEEPLFILDKILKNCKKYVIIHRQDITNYTLENGFYLSKQESYGGFTFHSILNRMEFNNILNNCGFSIIKELNSGLGLQNNYSFLLKKD